MAKVIKFKRGLESARSQITPAAGEPIFTTDTKKVFIGDGVTKGGIPVGALKTVGVIKANQVSVFADDQGESLKAVAVADLMADYITKFYLETRLTQQLAVKVESSKVSDNALKLNNRADYLTPDIITNNYNEDSTLKVASARAVQQLYATTQAAKVVQDNAIALKLDKSSVINSVTNASETLPASANSAKVAYDTALVAGQSAASSLAAAQSAQNTANVARSEAGAARGAPDLATERKRAIYYGTSVPSGGSEEGTLYIQY